MAERIAVFVILAYLGWACWMSYQDNPCSISNFISSVKKRSKVCIPYAQTSAASIPGYVGVLGAIVCFVGMFMPFGEIWFVRVSLFSALKEHETVLLFVIIAGIVISGLFYSVSLHPVACTVSIITAIVLFYAAFAPDGSNSWVEISFDEMFSYLEYGFWVIVCGVVLMVVSPLVMRVNQGIHKMFLPLDAKKSNK